MKKYRNTMKPKKELANPKTENWDGTKRGVSKENKGFGPCHYSKHKN